MTQLPPTAWGVEDIKEPKQKILVASNLNLYHSQFFYTLTSWYKLTLFLAMAQCTQPSKESSELRVLGLLPDGTHLDGWYVEREVHETCKNTAKMMGKKLPKGFQYAIQVVLFFFCWGYWKTMRNSFPFHPVGEFPPPESSGPKRLDWLPCRYPETLHKSGTLCNIRREHLTSSSNGTHLTSSSNGTSLYLWCWRRQIPSKLPKISCFASDVEKLNYHFLKNHRMFHFWPIRFCIFIAFSIPWKLWLGAWNSAGSITFIVIVIPNQTRVTEQLLLTIFWFSVHHSKCRRCLVKHQVSARLCQDHPRYDISEIYDIYHMICTKNISTCHMSHILWLVCIYIYT